MRLRLSVYSCAVAYFLAAAGAPAVFASTVQPLMLPPGFTIAPEAGHRLMTISADGIVYGIANRIGAPEITRAVRWRGAHGPEVFVPSPGPNDHFGGVFGPRVDGLAPASAPYVTVARTHDGAYLGVQFTIDLWVNGTTRKWIVPACANVGYYSPHIYAIDGNRIALTVDPSSNGTGIDLSSTMSVEANLPQAIVLEADRCQALGTGILTALSGTTAAGYIGYLNGRPAPWFVNQIVQRWTALRWFNGHEQSLGLGVPFATSSHGAVAGATALPGHANESMTGNFFGPAQTYVFATPHAVVWSPSGKPMMLFHNDARSIAWDINEKGAVVGMFQSVDGRHFAFLSEHGKTRFLDDLPHPPGWRFESADAIGADGTIVGIGTYDGVATAFVWRAG